MVRSLVRAREQRRVRGRQHRQTLALATIGVGGWSAVVLAGRLELALVGAGWWLLVSLMLDWHLGLVERPDGAPLAGLGAANVLSLLRLAAVPALPALDPRLLAAALGAAGALDVLDGRLARARNEVTRLGFWLDGAADGVLLGTAALVLASQGRLPTWAAGIVLARFALPWLGIATVSFVRAQVPGRGDAVSGKPTGVALFSGLVLCGLGFPGGPAFVVAGAGFGLATLAATGALRLARRDREAWLARG